MTYDDLANKYNMVFFDGKRYYAADLSEHSINYLHTIPYLFRYRYTDEIYSNTWIGMILNLLAYLNKYNHKTDEELLSFNIYWSSIDIFINEKSKGYTQFESVYVYTGFDATHSMWLIQSLIDFYGLDKKQCEFYIRRYQSSEPQEVKEFVIEDNKSDFINFVMEVYHFSLDYSQALVRSIDVISEKVIKRLKWVMLTNLFLVDDYKQFCSFKNKLKKEIMKRFKNNQHNVAVGLDCINYLDNFYGYKNTMRLNELSGY